MHVNIENTADERKCAEGVPNYWIVTLPVRTFRASRLGDADDGRRDQIIDGQLDHAGILERVAKGRQVFYEVNRQCPVFEELRAIISKTSGLVDVLRAP